jgi:hypothetical protein
VDPVDARRKARLTYAKRRLRRILAGEPKFTPEQLAELAAEFARAAA